MCKELHLKILSLVHRTYVVLCNAFVKKYFIQEIASVWISNFH